MFSKIKPDISNIKLGGISRHLLDSIIYEVVRIFGFYICRPDFISQWRHKPHRLIKTRLFWTSGRFCGHHMRQDKTNTEFGGQRIFPAAANADKRGPECQVPKKQFPASKKKKRGRVGIFGFYRVLLHLSDVRHLRILSRYPGIGRIIHPRKK
jgi:hypothetical protein